MKITKIQSNTNFGMLKISAKEGTNPTIAACRRIYGALAYFKTLETDDVCCFFGRNPKKGRGSLSAEDYLNEILSFADPKYSERAGKTSIQLEEEMGQYLKDAGVEYETYPDPIILTEECVQEFCQNRGWHIKPQEMHNHPLQKFFSMD